MSTAPFDIIAGPADVYVAAVGASVPAVNLADTDGSFSTWTKLGFTEGGVKAKHTQSVTQIMVDQRTGPVKAIRGQEGLEISFALAELTLEHYKYLLNTAAVTALGAVYVITLSGDSGTDAFKLTYAGVEGATSFVRQTNQTAAAIQAALRTATSDAGLLVTGTTDAGPFTVTFSNTTVAPGVLSVTSGTGGLTGVVTVTNPEQKVVDIYQGLDAGSLALLLRGPSPYMSAFLQYAVPVVVQTDSPEVDFVRDNKAVLQTTFVAIEDPNAATPAVRFGTITAQTS